MITQKRHDLILEELVKEGHVQVADLVLQLATSESTIRRDLSQLEASNLLRRVHGGAVIVENKTIESSYSEKLALNVLSKQQIAKVAASYVQDGETIYLDAGTSTYEMIPFLTQSNIIVVTNGFMHVQELAKHQITCYTLGGEIKAKTKAIVGYEAYKCLERYQFDKCFIGANGVHEVHGFTTPDSNEAMLKEKAIALSRQSYVLADRSKFNKTSFIKFAPLESATIITNFNQSLTTIEEKTNVKRI